MVILDATVEGIRSLKDKSLNVTLNTQELPPDDIAKLFTYLNQFVHIAIKNNEFVDTELGELVTRESSEFDGNKSPSQRLRAVLYRNWELEPMGYDDFNLYYIYQVEKIIQHFKNKL